jgi:glucose/arabinose dehydrogenase
MNDLAGKTLRLRDDGTVPPDNPFVGRAGHRPEIFSYGHQNVHALVAHPETGEIWGIEHGDEANILKPGGNYGWPYVSVGGSGGASGTPEPAFPLPPGLTLVAPRVEWKTPDIHPTGMAFYTADRFPKWKGSIFVGGLSTEQLHRTALTADGTGARENLFSKIGHWLRDVRQGPDGLIYFTTYDDPDPAGTVRRVEPAQ